MNKILAGLIVSGLLVGCGPSHPASSHGRGSHSSSSSGTNTLSSGNSHSSSTGTLTNLYGYDKITIYNNVNTNDSRIKSIQKQHFNQPDFINVTINHDVHCEDYQFNSGDLQSSYDDSLNYVKYGSTAESTDYCEEKDFIGTDISGSSTIVIAFNFH